jgi:hypothetical protein
MRKEMKNVKWKTKKEMQNGKKKRRTTLLVAAESSPIWTFASEAKECMAVMIERYPVQRQMFPSKLSSICCKVGLGFCAKSPY